MLSESASLTALHGGMACTSVAGWNRYRFELLLSIEKVCLVQEGACLQRFVISIGQPSVTLRDCAKDPHVDVLVAFCLA